MRTIAFVTQKGGAGKSTLASGVAVAASAAGERVVVIDLDPLQTLVTWSATRLDTNLAVEHAPHAKLSKVIDALGKKGVTLVVIDAPGQGGDETAAAIRAADLCIIPARPNAFDLWASEKTRAQVKEAGCDYAFLLNQCPPSQQSARVELGAKALQAIGGLLAPLVSSRVDYQEAARLGLGVTEYNPDGVAAQEMKELWTSIKRRLKRGAAKPAARAEAKNAASGEARPAAKPAPKADSSPKTGKPKADKPKAPKPTASEPSPRNAPKKPAKKAA